MDFLIPGSRSLKDKRRALKSLKQLLHNRYNCSVAETEFQDVWTRCRLVACVVSGDSRHANTIRLAQSMMATRYRKPLRIGI